MPSTRNELREYNATPEGSFFSPPATLQRVRRPTAAAQLTKPLRRSGVRKSRKSPGVVREPVREPREPVSPVREPVDDALDVGLFALAFEGTVVFRKERGLGVVTAGGVRPLRPLNDLEGLDNFVGLGVEFRVAGESEPLVSLEGLKTVSGTQSLARDRYVVTLHRLPGYPTMAYTVPLVGSPLPTYEQVLPAFGDDELTALEAIMGMRTPPKSGTPKSGTPTKSAY